MEVPTKKVQDVPVSAFLGVIIIVVFSLYLTTAIKTIPCGKDVLSSFYSNFVHIEPYHLIANLYALYALSRVEQRIGSKQFVAIVIFSLFFNTLVETGIHKLNENIPCSIGFSGVLFGIMTWELVTSKKIDLYLLTAIAGMVILPSIYNPKASLIGHAIGAISGVASGLIWNKLAPILKLNSE